MRYNACKGVKLAGENDRGIQYRDVPVLTINSSLLLISYSLIVCDLNDHQGLK